MSWLGNLFGGSVSEIIKATGGAIDSLVTSDEERIQLHNALKTIEIEADLKRKEFEQKYEEEVTKRWVSDNQSSRLARNIRPLVLAYLTVAITVLAVTDGNIVFSDYTFSIDSAWVELIKVSYVTAIAAYFGSRGFEKVKGASK